jgi:hypothetical protein
METGLTPRGRALRRYMMKKIFGPLLRRGVYMRLKNSWKKTALFCFLCAAPWVFAGCPASPAYDFALPDSSSYYVASWGSDANPGIDEELPFKTLAKAVWAALSGVQKDSIVILDNLTAASEGVGEPSSVFVIGGTGGREITIAGRDGISLSAGREARAVLRVTGRSRVVLEGITLEGSQSAGLVVEGGSSVTGRGLVIEENVLGAQISEGSSFTLEDGRVIKNANVSGPGGVHVRGQSIFTMGRRALIQDNSGTVGGVLVEERSRFIMMQGGEIAGNRASLFGGGVCLDESSLEMGSAASISSNAAGGDEFAGGGVALINRSTLIMRGNSRITGNEGMLGGHPSGGTQTFVSIGGGGAAMQNLCEITLTDNSVISGNNSDKGMAVYMRNNCRLNLQGNAAIHSPATFSLGWSLPEGLVWGDDSCRFEMSGRSHFSDIGGRTVYHDVVLRNKCVFVMRENSGILTERISGKTVFMIACDSFTMTDNARIKGFYEDGVFMTDGGVFRMDGKASITGGYTSSQGVYIGKNTEFIMDGEALIADAGGYGEGGGVEIGETGRFIMNGGTISHNNARKIALHAGPVEYTEGGGVRLGSSTNPSPENPTFIMSGGEVRSNMALYGGGIAVFQGNFIKTGGVITGSNEADEKVRNTAASGGAGASVFISKRVSGTGSDIFMENTLPESKKLSPPYTASGGWQD